jgi:alpha-N-arabinofuranosidase
MKKFFLFVMLLSLALFASLEEVGAQKAQARIKIDIERQTGAIDKMIYGNFVEHLGRCWGAQLCPWI